MIRKLCLVVLSTMLLIGSGAVMVPTHAYTPLPGAQFNNPLGNAEAKHRLAAKLRQTIRSAPRNSVIRIAVYSFDRKDLGDALVAACDRGVSVQIVINDNWISGQVLRLQRRLGADINPRYNDRCHPRDAPPDPTLPDARQPYPEPSFLKVCYRACRLAGPGNQHMKIYMFSKAGSASNVIMVGSNNMTYYAARTHWNDTITVKGSATMWADYGVVFRQLAEDVPVAKPYMVFRHGSLTTEFGPRPGVSFSQDPIARRLAGVSCRAKAGTGTNGRTVIRIAMYAWNGERGLNLAKRVARLRREGCVVRAILSGPGRAVRKTLRSAGVSIRSADLDLDLDPETGFGETRWEHFTHEKWMSLNGTWQGAPARIVWTGSENWSNLSLRNDEVTLQVRGGATHRSYTNHFEAMWSNPLHTRKL